MTAGDLSAVLVETIRKLSSKDAECESWRLVALATMGYAANLQRELSMVDAREYVHRRRTEDRLDLFLDHRDIRQEAA